MRSIVTGFGLGFLVALQLGPMSLFLIRSTLRAGFGVGLAIGAGIACVDALYAALGAAGAAPFLGVAPLRLAFGVVGAGALVFLGGRTLVSAFRVRSGLEVATEVATPRRAFRTAVAATASNPATIGSWAAIFAAASSVSGTIPVFLVAGVGMGSLTWVTVLALLVAAVRRPAGPKAIAAADAVAGVGLVGFGAATGYGAINST